MQASFPLEPLPDLLLPRFRPLLILLPVPLQQNARHMLHRLIRVPGNLELAERSGGDDDLRAGLPDRKSPIVASRRGLFRLGRLGTKPGMIRSSRGTGSPGQ